jgi:hypothetical protein
LNSFSIFFTKPDVKDPKKLITYCSKCWHRVGSRKIHEQLHKLADDGLDLESHHNIIIGRVWETFEDFGKIRLEWTDLHDQGSHVEVQLNIDWETYSAMTAIDREIRNVLGAASADIKAEEEVRQYYATITT